MTPACSIPSTMICHTAQAQTPVPTAQRTDEKEIVQLEQRFPEHHVLNNQKCVPVGNKQTIVSQPCVDNQGRMERQIPENSDVSGDSGEHVIHHVVQAISEENHSANVAMPEGPAKNMDETKTMETLSDITLQIRMEMNGGSVEEVDSIGQTVTVETSESYENSPIKERRKMNSSGTMSDEPFSAKSASLQPEVGMVRVNGNHGDVRGSRTP